MEYRTIFPVFVDENTCRFTVWASKAEKMELVTQSRHGTIEMEYQGQGYWSTTLKGVNPGMRYKYQINGEASYPDPGSLSQPEGVHASSEVIRPGDFPWTDEAWNNIPLMDMIMYELHTGTFSERENFEGIIQKLDYLKDLGINAIEIMPVSQFSGNRNWGYDGVYPYAVHNSYGGAEKLMELVNACHDKEMAVILDVVYNHLGPEGNYASQYGHYFSENYSTPWGKPINFDGVYSDGVRNFFIQNALMWFRDFHMDGLRLDAVHAIYDFSAKHILQELAENVKELSMKTGKNYYLIAESNLNDVRYISSFSKGGYGLDAQWSDDFHHAIHAMTTGERNGYYMDFGQPEQLASAMQDAFVFDGKYSEFRKKTYGNSTRDSQGSQFIIFNQNHDQTGNRKHGERLISLVGFEKAKLIAGCMLVAPNVPMLFMGEEYGERQPFQYFVSHLDPGLNELVKEGRNREFRDFFEEDDQREVDPAAPEAFEVSKLSWNMEEDAEKKAMLAFYKKMIQLRRENECLKVPDKENLRIHQDGKLFILERWQNHHYLVCFMNFHDKAGNTQFPAHIKAQLKKVMDSSNPAWEGPGETAPASAMAGKNFTVPPDSFVIYSN